MRRRRRKRKRRRTRKVKMMRRIMTWKTTMDLATVVVKAVVGLAKARKVVRVVGVAVTTVVVGMSTAMATKVGVAAGVAGRLLVGMVLRRGQRTIHAVVVKASP